MPYMRQEIYEQPRVLAGLIDSEVVNITRIARELREQDVRYIMIAARGSSDNAARYAQYLFAIVNRTVVALSTPSVYSIYESAPDLKGSLVIGISQSGESPDIISVVKEARAQDVPTVAITNVPDSPLAMTARYVIDCHAGIERSIAATKTYTTQLTVLALLASALAGDTERIKAIETLPSTLSGLLCIEEKIASTASEYANIHGCAVLGRGYNFATAHEIALKLKELPYVQAEPYSTADFMHGPIALVADDFPVILVATRGKVYGDALALAAELRRRGAGIVTISDGEELCGMARSSFVLPGGVPEWLSPIAAIVPGQLLAFHLTMAKGLDPDCPRGLRKVTRTL